LAHGDRLPTLRDIVLRLHDLLEGRLSREDVSNWAETWIMAGKPVRIEKEVRVLLDKISGADTLDPSVCTPEYLYTEQDIRRWLAEAEQHTQR
jgi:hypothetical protein